MAAREAAPPTSPPKLTPDTDAAATLQRMATLQRLLDGTAGSGILPVRGWPSGHGTLGRRLCTRVSFY